MSTLLIAPTDLQELTASLKQGFAQMFQDMDLTKTFALNNELSFGWKKENLEKVAPPRFGVILNYNLFTL